MKWSMDKHQLTGKGCKAILSFCLKNGFRAPIRVQSNF